MKTDDEVLRDLDDLEMMKRPRLWPLGQFLPVKKRRADGGFPETGVLYPYDQEQECFALAVGANIYGDLGPVEIKQYATAEEIVAEGWIVD